VKQVISFHQFKRNSIQLDGTIHSIAATGFADTLKISTATITYNTGKSIRWGGTLANQRINSEGVINGTRIGAADTRVLTGTIHSFTADGRFFTGNIRKAVRCNYECSSSNALIPVSGIVEIIIHGDSAILDYGDGSCDRTYTVTINKNIKSYAF
jgi:hypothetical protein